MDDLATHVSGLETAYKTLGEQVKSTVTEMAKAIALAQGLSTESEIKGYLDSIGNIKPAGYDTGGYTGEWGGVGKLAVLHEKELVLNKADTENILSAVDIVRGLSVSMHSGLASMLAELATARANLTGNIQFEDNTPTVEQSVVINADFSGVENAQEIKDAFNDIVNLAA